MNSTSAESPMEHLTKELQRFIAAVEDGEEDVSTKQYVERLKEVMLKQIQLSKAD